MKVRLLTVVLAVLLSLCTPSYCYRILGVFPLNSKSHFKVFEGLMKSMADRGHRVDVVSSFPLKNSYENYHDVVVLPPTSPSTFNNITYEQIHGMGSVVSMVTTERGNNVCHALGNENLKKIIENPPTDYPYDLVITEMLVANCFIAVGHYLKVPVVGVSTYGRLPWVYDILGNPEQIDFVAKEFSIHPGFWQRINSFVKNSYSKWNFYRNTHEQDAILKKYFGKAAPTVRELESSVSLTLTNAHFITHGARPLVPSLIEVGGMHIDDKRVDPLFDDIQDFLDTSQHGIVYVNLGEDVLFETLPEHIIKAFYTVFEQIRPIRTLLRVRDFDALPPGIPPTVIVLPWVQQYRVLQHSNTRVFITHGGLLGMQEAMSTATPIVGIPLWGDQFENVDIAVKHNLGYRVDLESITEETLGFAVNYTLKNTTFKDSARHMRDVFFERSESPIYTACYWIEYVIKHGSVSLKSPMMNLSWFKISNLDIYVFFTLIVFMFIFSFMFFIRWAFMAIFLRFRRKPNSKKLL